MSSTAAFEQHRDLLTGIAYRMLGSRSEAEDAVQDVWLRWQAQVHVQEPRAWLRTATTRLCVDRLRSARARREVYTGPWLPEPLPAPAPDRAELAESLSTAFLLMLERLTPEQRAVLLLREVYGCTHAEIAEALDRSEASCRQISRRARQALGDRPRFEVDPARHAEVCRRFLQAVADGAVEDVLAVLAPDVVMISDGGGVVRAAGVPVHGAAKVAQVSIYFGKGYPPDRVTARPALLNGQLGVILEEGDRVLLAMTFHVVGDRIHGIYSVLNPEKLGGLA
ncbi:MAG: RNA polymerase sigma factor SigJ [Alphaproteobacteria bacterium]|nr:RNA polymerase sigma factor SigJ [Alphaproteobacteria bacterium]